MKTVQPVILHQLSQILMRHFGCRPKQASDLAYRLIIQMQAYDLEIIRGRWQDSQQRGEFSWESLAGAADELETQRNGIKPWLPPELQ